MSWKQVIYHALGETLGEEVRKYHLARRLRQGKLDRSEKELSLLPRLASEGAVALDIGANVGVYTRLLSRIVGPRGQVHAFEPVPGTYSMLVHNRRYLPHDNVVTYNVAVGNYIGLCRIELPHIGLTSIYRARLGHNSGHACGGLTVPMLTLDSLYTRCFKRLDFLKCDVEGAELLVVKGAAEAIERSRPTVLCEIGDGCQHFGYAPDALFRWFRERGYRAAFYDGRALVECDAPSTANSNANYLFLHPAREPIATGPLVS